ncbi:M28 family peptidase [Microcoleus sp. FACHB-672]|uniref:M28 family peptidase n=1 Tax=Microcoleus sp. FACHB-672 TaxID=2692825 RepID=UPI001685CE4F|nr:M28 family peptidase [Microcoleus sp. FACHB-672]MBD2043818.1 M20/M25/M40 family metallo-hydrolase [Microcoleus sp. FACHB-672]
MIQMPGESYSGEMLPLTAQEIAIRDALRRDIEQLAGQIGERNCWRYQQLTAAANFLEASFADSGYHVHRQSFDIDGQTFHNLEVEIAGTDKVDEIVIIGGHYDSVPNCAGANDNGTGTAAVLALARAFAGTKPSRTLRFVAFVNEEAPFFGTPTMGSLRYAQRCHKRHEKVVAMLSLETIGYYSDEIGSQKYPLPLAASYPLTGNFIGFVSNSESAQLLQQVIGAFRTHAKFPSEGAALPADVPGVGWSDQWAFWQQGYQAIMVTDTAPFRYPHYHTPEDTPDKIDFDSTARVVAGLEKVIAGLAELLEK